MTKPRIGRRGRSGLLIWETGLDAMIDYTEKVSRPSFEATGRLERVLAAAFKETQALVHVLTGSLKLSGRTASDFDGKQWSGTIVYGGESAGVNNPVEYAIYEMARGGEHDWFRTLPLFYEAFEEAMMSHFDG